MAGCGWQTWLPGGLCQGLTLWCKNGQKGAKKIQMCKAIGTMSWQECGQIERQWGVPGAKMAAGGVVQ